MTRRAGFAGVWRLHAGFRPDRRCRRPYPATRREHLSAAATRATNRTSCGGAFLLDLYTTQCRSSDLARDHLFEFVVGRARLRRALARRRLLATGTCTRPPASARNRSSSVASSPSSRSTTSATTGDTTSSSNRSALTKSYRPSADWLRELVSRPVVHEQHHALVFQSRSSHPGSLAGTGRWCTNSITRWFSVPEPRTLGSLARPRRWCTNSTTRWCFTHPGSLGLDAGGARTAPRGGVFQSRSPAPLAHWPGRVGGARTAPRVGVSARGSPHTLACWPGRWCANSATRSASQTVNTGPLAR